LGRPVVPLVKMMYAKSSGPRCQVGGETFDDLVPIEEGVSAWLTTDDGKEFAPPANAGGSGEKGGRRPGKGDEKPTIADAYNFIGRSLR
jgi:hypothetical protein